MILSLELNGLVRGVVKANGNEALSFFTERFKEGTLHGDTFSFVIPANTPEEAERVVISRLQNLLVPKEIL
jgi:hypothetical protein